MDKAVRVHAALIAQSAYKYLTDFSDSFSKCCDTILAWAAIRLSGFAFSQGFTCLNYIFLVHMCTNTSFARGVIIRLSAATNSGIWVKTVFTPCMGAEECSSSEPSAAEGHCWKPYIIHAFTQNTGKARTKWHLKTILEKLRNAMLLYSDNLYGLTVSDRGAVKHFWANTPVYWQCRYDYDPLIS